MLDNRTVRDDYFGNPGSDKKRELAIELDKDRRFRLVLEMNKSPAHNKVGTLFIFKENDKAQVDSIACSDICLNPQQNGEFFAVAAGKIHQYRIGEQGVERKGLLVLPDSIGYVREMQFDPRANVMVILHSNEPSEDVNTLSFLNVANGKVLKEMSDTDFTGPMAFTPEGHLLIQEIIQDGKSCRLRSIKTNLSTYRRGEAEALNRKEIEIAERVRQGLAGIRDELAGFTEAEKSEVKQGEAPQMVAARKELGNTLDGIITETTDKEGIQAKDIEQLLGQILALSRKPDYAIFLGTVFEPRVRMLRELHDGLRSREINDELARLSEAPAVDAEKLNGNAARVLQKLSGQLEAIDRLIRENSRLQGAQKIEIGNEIVAQRGAMREAMQRLREKSIESVSRTIEEGLAELARLLAVIDDAFILESMSKNDVVTQIQENIHLLPDVSLELDYTEKLKAVFDGRREEIRKIEAKKKRQQEAEYKQLEGMVAVQLAQIREELAQLKNENEIQEFRLGSPSITNLNKTLDRLPPERANLIRTQLEDEIASAINRLEAKQHVLEFEGDVVSFGKVRKVRFPIFHPKEAEKETWKLSPVLTPKGDVMMQLKSNLGRLVRLPDEISLDPDEPLVIDRLKYRVEAKKPDSYLNTFVERHPELIPESKRNVPEKSGKWEHSEAVDTGLEKTARALSVQRRNQEGMVILEGEAGTGKNVLIDMFAHYTNREVYMFNCNAKNDKEDLTRFYEFDPNRGTYRLNSIVVEAIQTPGAILILDEVNTLPPEVAKMLNSLLDYRRTLNFTEGGQHGKKGGVKADPEVLIMGTMNPQNYAGVQKLSPELISRSRIVRIDYPPEKRKERYAVDEALIYRKYLPDLQHYTRQQFIEMWNAVINGDDRKNVESLLIPETEAILRDIKILVVTANKFRKAYMDYKLGQSMEELEFVFSIREGVNIVQEYAMTGGDIKQAIREVVLPKIADEKMRGHVDQAIIAQV
ncbi:AAA family ATPase [Candidatus Peregrinibacteria bacterium]|nr:AAA family ATPase [Candidatus Peregrinibacteria bacterium]